MELTIEQTLQLADQAIKNGKDADAVRLLRAVVQSVPRHPLANRNLALLARADGKVEQAIPLFKTALEAEPSNAEHWFSYIEALIEGELPEAAMEVLAKGKKMGLKGARVDQLEESLLTQSGEQLEKKEAVGKTVSFAERRKLEAERKRKKKAEKERFKDSSPSQKKSNYFLSLYQAGSYREAESTARAICEEYPQHPSGWKMLGAVLQQLDDLAGALSAFSMAAELEPKAADCHFNMGSVLQKLDRLEDAEQSFRRAIELKSDFFESHYNLAAALRDQGKFEDAAISYREALKSNPGHVGAHNNLSITLQELGNFKESEQRARDALRVEPDNANAYNNLGVSLLQLGKLEDAVVSCTKAVEQKSDYVEAMINLSLIQEYLHDLNSAKRWLERVVDAGQRNHALKAKVNIGIFQFLEGRFAECRQSLLASNEIQNLGSSVFKEDKIFQRYLLRILDWMDSNMTKQLDSEYAGKLYVIGESHSLVSHHIGVQSSVGNFIGESFLIKGCKQWDLGNNIRNKLKIKFEKLIDKIPARSRLLLAIGEIDCRLDSGIIKHHDKNPEKDIQEIVAATVRRYLDYVSAANQIAQHQIVVQGVPCPNIDTSSLVETEIVKLIETIRLFNLQLKELSREKDYGFLDVHTLTDRGDGYSNKKWHIDTYHLSPDGMIEAWKSHAFL